MNSPYFKKKDTSALKIQIIPSVPQKREVRFTENLNQKTPITHNKLQGRENYLSESKQKKDRIARSLHNKEDDRILASIANSCRANASVIVQKIDNQHFTTNIQNNLNININTPTVVNCPGRKSRNSPQLKRGVMTLGSNQSLKNIPNNEYFESMKTIFDSRSFYRIKEELSEEKRKNEKLQNEIKLLNEKLRSSKSVSMFNEQKCEVMKKQYQDIIDSLNNRFKRYVTGTAQYTEQEDKKQAGIDSATEKKEENRIRQLTHSLESTFKILLEIIELFLIKLVNTTRDSVIKNPENISYSIDVYESSINNDDERRCVLIEQIQSLVLFKLKFLRNVFSLNLDKEISRVKNWSGAFFNKDISISANNFSLSNISNTKLKRDITMFKDNLSVSSSEHNNSSNIYPSSPKFYRNISSDSFKDPNEDKLKAFEIGKDENYSTVLNESAIKELNTAGQNDSFNFNINEENINFNESFNEQQRRISIINSFGNIQAKNEMASKINFGEMPVNSCNCNNDFILNTTCNFGIGNENEAEKEMCIPGKNIKLEEDKGIEDNANFQIGNIESSNKCETAIEHLKYVTSLANLQVEPQPVCHPIKTEIDIKEDLHLLYYRNNSAEDKPHGEMEMDKHYFSENKEDKMQHNNMIRGLTIGLNDEPTEFNVEELELKHNSEKKLNESMREHGHPVILSPIVSRKVNNISLTDI